MKYVINEKLLLLVPFAFVALLLLAMPAFSADRLSGDMSHRFGKKDVSAEAVEVVGFFHGVAKGFVKIKNQKTYRMRSYIAAPDMIITRDGQEIDLLKVWPSSIVKLIVVDAEVVEIIMIRGSS